MKVKLLIGLFAIGLLAFNFSLKRNGESEKRIALQNISVMQVNAVEIWCDQLNETPCTIIFGNAIGNSNGFLRAEN